MQAFDLQAMLEPLAPDAPTGPDLSEDARSVRLFQLAQGREESHYGRLYPAEEPNWPEILHHCEELLTETRDVRLAVLFAQAALHVHGWRGLRTGLELIDGLLARHWDDVHPQLDPGDERDPTERLNGLLNLCDLSALRGSVHRVPIVTSSRDGSVTLRDLREPARPASPLDDTNASDPAPTPAQRFPEILASCDPDVIRASKDALDSSIQMLRRMVETLASRVDQELLPDFTPLVRDMQEIQQHLPKHAVECDPQHANGTQSMTGFGPGTANSSASPATEPNVHSRAATPNREEVLKLLDRVSEYFQSYEPSSPIPFLLEGAKRLATLSFVEIYKELGAEGMAQIEKLGNPGND